MDTLRYIIEAKDQDGWFDYAIVTRKEEALRLAADLKESFGKNIRVIDQQNMIEVSE